MSATRIGVFAAAAMVALLRPLSAQQPQLALGQWVRVVSLADSSVHKGRLVFVVADTVVVDDGRRIAERVEYLAVGGQGRLEVPRRLRSHPVAGALLGAALGMVVGAESYSASAMFSCLRDCGPPTHTLLGRKGRIVVGGVIGLGLGALAGAHVHTTRWDAVPPEQLQRLRVAIVPQPNGAVGFGASLGF